MSISDNKGKSLKAEIKTKWSSDLARYPSKPWLKEPSILAVYWYRHGQSVDLMNPGVIKTIRVKFYWFIFHILEVLLGISIAKTVKSGGGLRIHHFGNIFIHKNVILGKNCTLRQGVTIGNRYNDDAVPILDDNIEIGAYAQILGAIKVGDNAKIGAMSLVLNDVPKNSTACGIPAKVVKASYKNEE